MIGYKNDKYIKYGKFAARLDDLLNYIPARIALQLIPFSALLAGCSPLKSIKTALKDAKIHPSPNSGISEAAYAGALQVSLGGPAVYHGKLKEKDFFGGEFHPPEPRDILKAVMIMWISALFTLVIYSVIFYIIF